MKELVQKIITLKVNGKDYDITVGTGRNDMPESETLAHTLRDRLGLTGLKIGCDQGACGCCTVIMDGKAVTSCMTLTMDCDGSEITTIEGLAGPGHRRTGRPAAGIFGQLRISVRFLYPRCNHDSKSAFK